MVIGESILHQQLRQQRQQGRTANHIVQALDYANRDARAVADFQQRPRPNLAEQAFGVEQGPLLQAGTPSGNPMRSVRPFETGGELMDILRYATTAQPALEGLGDVLGTDLNFIDNLPTGIRGAVDAVLSPAGLAAGGLGLGLAGPRVALAELTAEAVAGGGGEAAAEHAPEGWEVPAGIGAGLLGAVAGGAGVLAATSTAARTAAKRAPTAAEEITRALTPPKIEPGAALAGVPVPTREGVRQTVRQVSKDVRRVGQATTLPTEIKESLQSVNPARLRNVNREGIAQAAHPWRPKAKTPPEELLDPKTITDTQERARAIVRAGEEARTEVTELQSVERGQRAAGFESTRGKGIAGVQEASRMASGQLIKEGDKPIIKAPTFAESFTAFDKDTFINAIDSHPLSFNPNNRWDWFRARKSVQKLFDDPETPLQPSEFSILDDFEVFGKQGELAQVVTGVRGESPLAWGGRVLMDLFGVPRAVKSTGEFSASLRQGAPYLASKAWWKAHGPEVRSFLDRDYAADFDDRIHGGPKTRKLAEEGNAQAVKDLRLAQMMERDGLDLPSLAGSLTKREEEFRTTIVQRLPVIGPFFRGFEAAYVNYLNALRKEVYRAHMENLVDIGPGKVAGTAGELSEGRDVSRSINILTGRASLPAGAQRSTAFHVANQTLFAPKWLLSRFQVPVLAAETIIGRKPVQVRQVAGKNKIIYMEPIAPAARRRAAKALVTYMGAYTAIGGALWASGAVDMQLDPRSSDFGKMKFGPMRWDPGAGMLPVIRYTAQIATGQGKALSSSNIYDKDRIDTGLAFLRGRLNPGVPAMIVDTATGETFLGDDVGERLTERPGEEARERFLPIYYGDIADAVQEFGWARGVALTVPGFFGVGPQTFRTVSDERTRAFEAGYDALPVAQQEATSSWDGLVNKVGRDRAIEIISPHIPAERLETLKAAEAKQTKRTAQAVDEQQARSSFGYLRTEVQGLIGELEESSEGDLGLFYPAYQEFRASIRVAAEIFLSDFSPREGGQVDQDTASYFAVFQDADRFRGSGDEKDILLDQKLWRLEQSLGPDRWGHVLDNVYAARREAGPLERRAEGLKRDLGKTGYWSIDAKLWQDLGSSEPGQVLTSKQLQTMSQYESWDAYVQALEDRAIQHLMETRGLSYEDARDSELADEMARLRRTEGTIFAQFTRIRNVRKVGWAGRNPDIARETIAAGIIRNPNVGIEEAIGIEQPIEPQSRSRPGRPGRPRR